MKVFATRFLEPMKTQGDVPVDDWSWEPTGGEAHRIFASGASTNTRASTYAAETDDRADSDRPNEGHMVA